MLSASHHGAAETFFLAVSLFDRYIAAVGRKCGLAVTQGDLYLIGLACILIASKFEDMRHIQLEDIITEAGHSKFSKEQILATERDILCVLEFRILSSDS